MAGPPGPPAAEPPPQRRGVVPAALRGWVGAAVLLAVAFTAYGAVSLGAFDSVSTINPVLVDGLAALAAVALVSGVAGRRLRWWATWGLGIAVFATVAVAVTAVVIHRVGLVTEHYPPSFAVWVWCAVWSAGVALTGWWSGGPAIRVGRFLTIPLVTLSAFLLINDHYGYWPQVSVLLNRPESGQVSASVLAQELQPGTGYREAGLAPGETAVGQYGPVRIGGSPVAFAAQEAYVWLPPAFFDAADRRTLPVILMLPGYPGDVQDWVKAGEVIDQADAYARAHGGRAPVMVFVDENGTRGVDTECVNGARGAAASYLVTDVPDWIESTLGITADPARWGVVGFSEGGTCALDIGARRPGVWGRFLDIAGDLAPDHGNPAHTLVYLYGGNRRAMADYDPSRVLARHRYRGVDAWFAAGLADRNSVKVAERLSAEAERAGMSVHLVLRGGGHTWTFARTEFHRLYDQFVAALSGPSATVGWATGPRHHHPGRPASGRARSPFTPPPTDGPPFHPIFGRPPLQVGPVAPLSAPSTTL